MHQSHAKDSRLGKVYGRAFLRGRTQQARLDLPPNLALSKGNLGTARNATRLYAIDVAEFPEWCSRLGFFRCSGLNALGGFEFIRHRINDIAEARIVFVLT